MAGSKSAENTSLPFTVQVNLFRILRGTVFPPASLRRPVSMMCDTRALTSTRSPFFACFLSSLMRGFTSAIESLPRTGVRRRAGLAAAAADRNLHRLAPHEKRSVVHLGDGDDVLGFGQAD